MLPRAKSLMSRAGTCSSESESDSDAGSVGSAGSGAGGDRLRSHRVRALAAECLQVR